MAEQPAHLKGYQPAIGMLFSLHGKLVAITDSKASYDTLRDDIYNELKAANAHFAKMKGSKQMWTNAIELLRMIQKAVDDKDQATIVCSLKDLAILCHKNVNLMGALYFNSGYALGFAGDLDKFSPYCSEGGEIGAVFESEKVGCYVLIITSQSMQPCAVVAYHVMHEHLS